MKKYLVPICLLILIFLCVLIMVTGCASTKSHSSRDVLEIMRNTVLIEIELLSRKLDKITRQVNDAAFRAEVGACKAEMAADKAEKVLIKSFKKEEEEEIYWVPAKPLKPSEGELHKK